MSETLTRLKTRSLTPNFGSEVLGVQFAAADADTRTAIAAEFHRSGALVLRGQTMGPEDLLDFVRMFGVAEGHTLQQYTLPGYPEIYILSNKVIDGRPIGAHNDGVGWHTDYSYKAEPVMCTMLYAVEVPPEGSDTLIADMCAAYEALAPERRAQLDGLKLHHSYQHFMENREHGRMILSEQIKAENPDVIHPLIRTHPADGRRALWVSTGTVKTVIGMSEAESMRLLEELVAFATQDQFVYRHKWETGDVLIWDNRCTLHTGTLYDDTKYNREMHRLWARGDRPY